MPKKKEYREYGALGKPGNELEEEIAERIFPMLAEEDIARIKENKLTLSGCLAKCMEKGHKYEVKSGKSGIARISPEQHWKWVSEYFGVKVGIAQPEPVPEQAESEPIDSILSALLDF